MQLFALLYVSDFASVNLRGGGSPVLPYVRLAVQLTRSALRCGQKVRILTNDADGVRSLVRKVTSGNVELDLVEVEFRTVVPRDIGFYAAHFKVDAFRFLATQHADIVGLIDLDVRFQRALVFSREGVFGYDITEQVVPAYGSSVILNDLRILDPLITDVSWFGGEFLAGPPLFFRDLVERIEELLPGYIQNYRRLHHQGDEILVVAAIALFRRIRKWRVADVGNDNLIARYWSGTPSHVQRSLYTLRDTAILHLPQDKRLLGATGEYGRGKFFLIYFGYVLAKRLAKQVRAFFR